MVKAVEYPEEQNMCTICQLTFFSQEAAWGRIEACAVYLGASDNLAL